MRRTHVSKTVATTILVGVASLTVACSSSSTPASSTSAASTTAATSAAAAPGSAAGSSELAGTTVTPAELNQRLVAGYADITSVTGTLQAGAAGQTVDATFKGAFSEGKPTGVSVNMTIPSNGQSIPFDIIVADGSYYLSSPPLLSQIGVDKKWLLVDPNSTNPSVAQIAQQLQGSLDSISSPDQTAQLANSASQITEVGVEDHNGQQATHYQLLIDPAAMAAAAGGVVPTAESAAVSSAADSASQPILVNMWVNSDDRVIGTTTEIEVSGQQVSAVYDITSFNDPVTITAPDPSETSTG